MAAEFSQRDLVREVGCLMRCMRLTRPPGCRLNDPGMVTCEALHLTAAAILGSLGIKALGAAAAAELGRSAAEGGGLL